MPQLIKELRANHSFVKTQLTNEIIDNGLTFLEKKLDLVLCEIKNTKSLVLLEERKYQQVISFLKTEPDAITEINHLFVGFLWLNHLPEFEEPSYQVAKSFLTAKYRGKGLGTLMYQYAIADKCIFSDDQQTPDADKMWQKLFIMKNFHVQGYDVKNQAFLNLFQHNHHLFLSENISTDNANILYCASSKKMQRKK